MVFYAFNFFQALVAHSSVANGMKGASKAMSAMNKEMAPTKQMKVMEEFQKQSTQMDMTVTDQKRATLLEEKSASSGTTSAHRVNVSFRFLYN
ncbi:vacuolar protein sorting-associated protein 2.3 [Artemisia annua]|uniref:Vacuolar protein sorting-associated protein 2.3 n=1 Tax=Artemisia annua TaxID=35608 RepID=A0A2U1KRL1_ARTAN|nr:vacuolar protein sorting-associated protein 2.3 [Artemisia annua]